MADGLSDLLKHCRNGDQEACRILVRRYQAGGLIMAQAIIGDRHLAQDAIQQAFLTVFSRLDQLRNPQAFLGWFRQIVRTEAMKIARRQSPHQSDGMEYQGDMVTPQDIAVSQEIRQMVRKALAELSAANRHAMEMFYLDEQNCSNIAVKLNVPAGTVKRRLYDSRQKLRRRLKRYVEEPPTDKQILRKCDDTLPL